MVATVSSSCATPSCGTHVHGWSARCRSLPFPACVASSSRSRPSAVNVAAMSGQAGRPNFLSSSWWKGRDPASSARALIRALNGAPALGFPPLISLGMSSIRESLGEMSADVCVVAEHNRQDLMAYSDLLFERLVPAGGVRTVVSVMRELLDCREAQLTCLELLRGMLSVSSAVRAPAADAGAAAAVLSAMRFFPLDDRDVQVAGLEILRLLTAGSDFAALLAHKHRGWRSDSPLPSDILFQTPDSLSQLHSTAVRCCATVINSAGAALIVAVLAEHSADESARRASLGVLAHLCSPNNDDQAGAASCAAVDGSVEEVASALRMEACMHYAVGSYYHPPSSGVAEDALTALSRMMVHNPQHQRPSPPVPDVAVYRRALRAGVLETAAWVSNERTWTFRLPGRTPEADSPGGRTLTTGASVSRPVIAVSKRLLNQMTRQDVLCSLMEDPASSLEDFEKLLKGLLEINPNPAVVAGDVINAMPLRSAELTHNLRGVLLQYMRDRGHSDAVKQIAAMPQ